MSSVARSFSGPAEAKTKFVPIKSLSYHNDYTNHTVLIPFSFDNGVLNISQVPGWFDVSGNGESYGFSWRMVSLWEDRDLLRPLVLIS